MKSQDDKTIEDSFKNKSDYKSILLPDIKFRIQKELTDLNLIPRTSVKWAIEYFDPIYKSICVDSKGNKFFLKANLVDQKEKKVKDFLREIFFYKSLSDFKTGENFPYYGIPKYIGNRGNKGLHWLLVEYIEGEKMGNWFSFSEKFLNNTYLNIFIGYVDFVQFLYSKISSSKVKFDFSELPRKDYYWLINEIQNLKSILANILGEKSFKLILKEIEKNREILNNTCHYLIHRDNHPENIIAVNQNKVVLLDWTDMSISNYVYDFADIWVHAWKNPQWQKMFLKKFIEKVNNKNEAFLLFKILLFYLLAVEIRNVSDDYLLSFAVKEKEAKKFQRDTIRAHSKTLNYICCDFN